MKEALKNYTTYVLAGTFILLGLGVSFIPLIASMYAWFNIDYSDFAWNPDWCSLGFAAIYFLVGYVIQDLTKVSNRRKTKNWAGELPKDVIQRGWERGLPFYFAALTLLLAAFIMLIFCVVNNVDTIREVILGIKH